jgi:probable addiction module antidote protein
MKITKKDVELTDFWEESAKELNSARKIKEFLNAANQAYDETKDIYVLFSALKLVALAKGNMSDLARDSKIGRKSVYNLFKKGSNPTIKNLLAVSQELGLSWHLCLDS